RSTSRLMARVSLNGLLLAVVTVSCGFQRPKPLRSISSHCLSGFPTSNAAVRSCSDNCAIGPAAVYQTHFLVAVVHCFRSLVGSLRTGRLQGANFSIRGECGPNFARN